MLCSNCWHELLPDAKFCSNCGAPVVAGAPAASSTETPAERRERERREDFERAWGSNVPEQEPSEADADDAESEVAEESPSQEDESDQYGGFATKRSTWEVERERLQSGQIDDEWSMSDLGPAKPQKRRTWLWVMLGIVVLIVLACCIGGWWLMFTDSGKNFIDQIEATQTAIADKAATPKP